MILYRTHTQRNYSPPFEKGEVNTYEKGMEIGIEQTTKNIVINLVKKGTPIKIIAEVTGLAEADLKLMILNANEL